jgi:tetratricopeptide (TPR) repeat protein
VDLLAAATKVDPQFGRILVDKHLPEHVVDQKGDSEKRLGWLFAQVGRYDDYARVVNNQIKLGISPENLGPVLSLLHDGAEALGCEAINVFWKACFDALQDTSSELQKLFHRAYRKWQRKHATVLVSADDGQSGRQRDDSPQDESACPISPVPYGDELVKRISMVQLLKRQGELAAACKLFREIIQLRPDLADAAIHFHEKLEHANEASIELLEAALLAKSITDNQAVDGFPSYLKACALSFGGEVRSAEKWIEHAAELIAQDRVGRAVDIWMGIYEYFPRSKQFFLNELLDLQSSMDSESFLSALGVLPRYAGNQKVLALLAHLARAVITTKTEVAHALYEQILVAESGADNRLNFSKYLLLQGEVNRAIALWTDAAGVHTFEKLLFLHFALRCGVTLTDLNDLVTKTVTEERLGCLAFAYQQLISTKKLLLATAIIEKLFECRQDPLSASDKAVLRLCLAHRGISEELKGALLEGLRERDLMCQGEIERLLAEVAQSGADITTLAKDKEMEDYLRRHMPTLKTGRFFSNLSERQPLFSPGKATSRMARSVIAKPYRMTDNNSRPGMKRRE